MNQPYHYTASGLDWVYLENGYEVRETKHGRGVAIQNVDGLYCAIMRAIIVAPWRLRGQEVRFLRARLGLSQSGLAKILRTKRLTVARWEAAPEKVITGPADTALRLYCAAYECGDETAHRIAELLTELDDLEHRAVAEEHFRSVNDNWERLPLAA